MFMGEKMASVGVTGVEMWAKRKRKRGRLEEKMGAES